MFGLFYDLANYFMFFNYTFFVKLLYPVDDVYKRKFLSQLSNINKFKYNLQANSLLNVLLLREKTLNSGGLWNSRRTVLCPEMLPPRWQELTKKVVNIWLTENVVISKDFPQFHHLRLRHRSRSRRVAGACR